MEFSPPKRIPKRPQERSKWFTVKASLSPEEKKEEKPVLILKPFSTVPHISFNKVKVGCTKICDLYISNPLDVDQVILIEKFPTDKGFSIENEKFLIKAGAEKAVKIVWEPVKALSCRETIAFRSSTGCKSQVYLLGTAYSPPKKTSQKISNFKSKERNPPKSGIKSIAAKIESCSQNLKTSEERKENFDILNSKDLSFAPMTKNSFKFPPAFEPRASFCLKADSEFPDSPIRRQTYTINSMLLNGRESEILPFHQVEIADDTRLEKEDKQNHFKSNFTNKPFSLQNSLCKADIQNPFGVLSNYGDNLNDSLENTKYQTGKDAYVEFNDPVTDMEGTIFHPLETTSTEDCVKTYDIVNKHFYFGFSPDHSSKNSKPEFIKPGINHNVKYQLTGKQIPFTSFESSAVSNERKNTSEAVSDSDVFNYPRQLKGKELHVSDFMESSNRHDNYSLVSATHDFSTSSLNKEACEDSSMYLHEQYSKNKKTVEKSTEKNFQLKEKALFMEIPFDTLDISSGHKKSMKHSTFSVLAKPSIKKTQKSSPFKAKIRKSKFPSSTEFGVKNLSISSKSGIKSNGKVSKFMPKKLSLSIPKMTESVVYHRNPFASMNIYYDEHWIEKQESAFTSWLNFILTPNEDYGSENMKVDSAKLWIESIKCTSVMPAPSKEELSLKAYTATRNLNALRKSSFNLYQSDENVAVIKKIEKEVDSKRLNIRKDCAIHADLGIKKNILEMLLSYNSLWLRIGLETLYGEVISLQNNSDVLGLSRFIVHRFLQNPEISSKYSLPSVINYYKKGYEDEIQRFILKKFLLLVFFLDTAKNVHLITHNPCLFNKNAKYKSSRDLLLAFSREYLSGEGDITKHLRYLGYKVSYQQTALEEFDFSVRNLATDLRCGLRLGRVVEILLKDWTISQMLRINTLNRLTKLHNNDVILKSLKNSAIEIENNIEAKHITDGDRDKTLDLLWQIIFKTQISKLIDKDLLKKENAFLCRSLKWRKDLAAYNALRKPGCGSSEQVSGILDSKLYKENEILQLLFQWCQIVCAHYDVKVHNFTSSFSDGRVLCLLLHHYHPNVLPYESIKTETSCSYFEQQLEIDGSNENCPFFMKNGQQSIVMEKLLKNEKDNLTLVFQKFKEVGNIPILSTPSDLSNTMPDEKVMITFVSYINIRLMELSMEIRAARKILHAWRSYMLRKQLESLKVEIRAVKTIQRMWRKFLCNKRLQTETTAAIIIQSYWRMYRSKRQLNILREKTRFELQTKNAIIIQAAFRGFSLRKYLSKCHDAAIVIQTYFRQWYAQSQFIKLRNAAMIIQQKYRAKIKGKSQKHVYNIIRQNVIKLQAYARGILIRRYFKKKQTSVIKIQAYVRMWLIKRKYNKIRNACITIQQKFRGYLLTEFYSQEYQNHRNAAIVIQRWYRSVKVLQYRVKCIVKIQAYVRMYLSRKKYLTLLQNIIKIQTWWKATSVGKKARQHYLQCYWSIICIQSFIRQCSARRKYSSLKKSTVIIQKYARAFIAQRKFKKLKERAITIQRIWRLKSLTKKTRLDYLLYRDKVVLAQSVIRQFLAVQRFKKQRGSAIIIQKNFRAYQLRKRFQLIKLSVISIQTKWRAVILGRQVRSIFLLYRHNIIFLQSLFRKHIAVIQFKKKKQSVILIQKYVRMRIARKKFLRLKKSAVIIQQAWRNILLGRNVRNYFLACQKSAIKIQSLYRMFTSKKNFILLKMSVATIEQYRLGKLQRKKFLDIRQKVIKLQSVFRCLIYRKNYLKSVRNITLVQACSRKFVQRKKYLQIRTSVLKVQRYYRAYQLMCSERKNYMGIKRGIIKFQALYRGWYVRKSMKVLNQKATLIQSTYRSWKAQSDYKRLRNSCLIVQQKYRAKLEMKKLHHEFVKMKKAAVKIQAFIRCCIARIQFNNLKLSVIKIQSYVRMIKSYTLYNSMKKAAVTIQQFYRSYKIMRKIQNDYIQKRLYIVFLQSKIRTMINRKRYLKQKKACILIQSLIRKQIQEKKYIKSRNAAILIQKFYRNHCVMKSQRARYIQLKKAAVFTQSHFRSIIARKKFLEEKKACILIQSYVRMHIQCKKYNRIRNAVVFVQQHYRNQRVMKIERNKYKHKRRAVILLQSVVRSFIQRKTFLCQKKACITIQSAVRMHIQQKKYIRTCNAAISVQRYFRNQILMKEQRSIYIKQRKAIILLQSKVRSTLARRRFLKKKNACILVQSFVRMHLQQKKYKKIYQATTALQKYYRCMKLMQTQRSDYLHKRQATIILQSTFRSFLARKKYLRLKYSCIKIQAFFRMLNCKDRFSKVKNAVICIQKYFRSWRLMKVQKDLYTEQKKAIILLQSRVRSFLVKKNFKIQKRSIIIIQSYARMYMVRKRYHEIHRAAVVLQKLYRLKQLTKLHHENFIRIRNSVIVLQSKVRCMVVRRRFLKQKQACIVIQSFVRMFICKVRYNKLCKAALVIQKYFRNYQITTEVQKKYLSLRTSSIIIQSYFRMYKCHKEFISLRSSVIKIQQKYKAVLKGKRVKQNFLQQKTSCIKIQAFVRMFLAIKKYSKLRNASITIQSKYRSYTARKKFIQLKKSVLTIQKYFKSWKITKTVRATYLFLRSSAIIIQSAIRSYLAKKSFKLYKTACIKIQAFVRKYICHKAYTEKRIATLILQKHFRAYLISKKVKEDFVYKRKCIITIQSFVRGFLTRCNVKKLHNSATKIQSIYRAYIVRQLYVRKRKSATTIQKYFRSFLHMKNIRQEYMQLKMSAIIIQSYFKKYRGRKEFLKKKAAVIALQAHVRMFIAQSKFNKMKKSICIIENYYLAYKRSLKEYHSYQKKKESCIKIQASWRSYSVRKKLKATVEAAVKIQRAFRSWKERTICKNMRSLTLNQTNLPNALRQQLWYIYLRKSTIDFQRAARTYLLKRHKAATIIQSYFRMKKVQQQYKRLKAAIKIQSYWRAYSVRRSITDAKVFEIQKKIKAADSSESNKLKNRTTRSLQLLFKGSVLQHILSALEELDVCTRLSPKCCERLVASGGLTILVQLVHLCNRSIPHMEIIKLATNILLNISKYEKTVDSVWKENGSIEIILKLMKIFREKGTAIFTKCCSLLWIFSQDPCKAEILKQDDRFVEQICSFHYLLTRKQSMEQKRFVLKAVASKSYNMKNMSMKINMCPRESQQIEPDWILGRQRRREFEDPIVAITSVMKSLDINRKGLNN